MSKPVPLTANIAIVDENGSPTPWFTQLWQNSFAQVLATQGTATTATSSTLMAQLAPPATVTNAANSFGVGPALL